jgi:hypothetical protein
LDHPAGSLAVRLRRKSAILPRAGDLSLDPVARAGTRPFLVI